jgi:hypothetical protein
MNTQCLTIGFVTTAAGRQLLEAARDKQLAASGRVLIAAMCGAGKTRPELWLQALQMMLRPQGRRTDYLLP